MTFRFRRRESSIESETRSQETEYLSKMAVILFQSPFTFNQVRWFFPISFIFLSLKKILWNFWPKMTNFLISSKSQTSLITNTKCTLEKTWIVNTADIYAEPPQRQKNFRLKFFESFAFKNQKKVKIFVSKKSFRHVPGFSALLGTLKLSNLSLCFILWHFMPFYLSMYLSFLSHFWYFLSIFSRSNLKCT